MTPASTSCYHLATATAIVQFRPWGAGDRIRVRIHDDGNRRWEIKLMSPSAARALWRRLVREGYVRW